MEKPTASTNLELLVIELKVKLESFTGVVAELKEMLVNCQANCLHNREGIYAKINSIQSGQDKQAGAQDVINKQKMLKPHWHLGASTWLLVLVAILQLIVLIRTGVHP